MNWENCVVKLEVTTKIIDFNHPLNVYTNETVSYIWIHLDTFGHICIHFYAFGYIWINF